VKYLAMGEGPDAYLPEEPEHHKPAPTVFYGRPKVYFLAICLTCAASAGTRPTPMPFGTQDARDVWAAGHRAGAGHHVDEAVEVRP